MLLLLLLALLFYRRAHRYDKLVLELKDQSRNQMQDLSGLQGSINELKINDERLKSFISSHMGMMREMIEACYHETNNRIVAQLVQEEAQRQGAGIISTSVGNNVKINVDKEFKL